MVNQKLGFITIAICFGCITHYIDWTSHSRSRPRHRAWARAIPDDFKMIAIV